MSDSTVGAVDAIKVSTMSVACDGGEGALGHPMVYLTLDKKTHDVVCPYCSRRFVLKTNAAVGCGASRVCGDTPLVEQA